MASNGADPVAVADSRPKTGECVAQYRAWVDRAKQRLMACFSRT